MMLSTQEESMKLAKKKLERKQNNKTSSLKAEVSPRPKAKSPSKALLLCFTVQSCNIIQKKNFKKLFADFTGVDRVNDKI